MTGSASYEVIGWFVTTANIGFLIPMTIVNLAALMVALTAVFIIRKGKYCDFDPTDSKPLAHASSDKLQGWEATVKYRFKDVSNFISMILA